MPDGTVDGSITPPAPLVRRAAAIAHAREDEAVLDPGHAGAVLAQPSDRADRARHEQEPIRQPPRLLRQRSRLKCRDRDTRKIVVRERGMADMSRDQNLVVLLSLEVILAVGELPVLE